MVYGFHVAGLAVMTVMLVTTCLTALVIVLCWNRSPIFALLFLLFFGSIELLYFSASLTKFTEGAWLPILLALILMTIMLVWHYTTIKKYEFDLHNKVSLEWLLSLGQTLGIARVPGIGVVFTDLISGIPANFSRFVTNLPAFHRVIVFVCVKSVPVPHVPPAERYLVGRVGPPSHRSYRCIIRYGYRDVHQDVDSFESELVDRLAEFVLYDWTHQRDTGPSFEGNSNSSSNDRMLAVIGKSTNSFSGTRPYDIGENLLPGRVSSEFSIVESLEGIVKMEILDAKEKKVRFAKEDDSSDNDDPTTQLEVQMQEEIADLLAARESGMAFILEHSHVRAKRGSYLLKRLAINLVYNCLKRNCRGPDVVLKVPPVSLLEVGMVYVV